MKFTPYTPYISSIAALTNPGVQNTGVAGVVGEANRPAAHRTAPQRCWRRPTGERARDRCPLYVGDALLWRHNGDGGVAVRAAWPAPGGAARARRRWTGSTFKYDAALE